MDELGRDYGRMPRKGLGIRQANVQYMLTDSVYFSHGVLDGSR